MCHAAGYATGPKCLRPVMAALSHPHPLHVYLPFSLPPLAPCHASCRAATHPAGTHPRRHRGCCLLQRVPQHGALVCTLLRPPAAAAGPAGGRQHQLRRDERHQDQHTVRCCHCLCNRAAPVRTCLRSRCCSCWSCASKGATLSTIAWLLHDPLKPLLRLSNSELSSVAWCKGVHPRGWQRRVLCSVRGCFLPERQLCLHGCVAEERALLNFVGSGVGEVPHYSKPAYPAPPLRRSLLSVRFHT